MADSADRSVGSVAARETPTLPPDVAVGASEGCFGHPEVGQGRSEALSYIRLDRDRYAEMAQVCGAVLSEHNGKRTVCTRNPGHEPVPLDVHSLVEWYREQWVSR